MPEIMDIFRSNAFHMVNLTEAINRKPIKYGMLNQMNLFPLKSTTSRVVGIEEKNGVLTLIPSRPRGGEPNKHKSGKRKMRYIEVPHFPLEDRITADDLEGLRRFGELSLQDAMTEINERELDMADDHDITLEFLRVGGLKGQVLDADGSVLRNWFTEFGIEEVVVDFALDTETTDVAAKCRQVTRHIEDNLEGDVMNNVVCLCAPDFFDDLVAHPTVKEAYRYQQSDANNPTREDLRKKGFDYHGVTFKEYRGKATNGSGVEHKFIPDGEGRCAPLGTVKTFATYCSPAAFFDTINTRGQRLYSRIAVDPKYNQWVDIWTESNILPVCHRPAVLVRVTA